MYSGRLGRWFGVDPLAEKYYSHSPYAFCGNNPIRRVDVDGADWVDKVVGVVASIADNATGINLRGSYTPTDAADYNKGQDVGDIASIAIGVLSTLEGGNLATGGVAISVASGGTLAAGGVTATAGGLALAAHGTFMAASGASNLTNQKGRVETGGDGNSLKPGQTSTGKETVTFTQKQNGSNKEQKSLQTYQKAIV